MQILEHGDPAKINPIVMFKCSNCGCSFKADKTEYRKEVLLTFDYYYCDCPECGEKADKIVEEGEKE